jgi:hypothetical protein
MNFIEKIVFFLGWIRIVCSPLLLSVIIGYCLYQKYDGTKGIVLGITTVALGLIAGVIWAERVRKKYGSMNYLGKINGSPELDYPEKKEGKTLKNK